MVDTVARIRFGPDTFTVVAAVTGGQLVEFGAGGQVQACAVDSTKWLGVALTDAVPVGTSNTDTVFNNPRVDLTLPPSEVAVAYTGVFKLKAVAALNPGDIVYPGATGQVQKATTTGRAVGIVVDPAGIGAGAYGLIRLF